MSRRGDRMPPLTVAHQRSSLLCSAWCVMCGRTDGGTFIVPQVAGFFSEYIIIKLFFGLWMELTRSIALFQVQKASVGRG